MGEARNNEEVSILLDNDSFLAIVNTSKWPPNQCITMATKHSLCQCLILEEVLDKRAKNIVSFSKGLDIGHLLPLIKRFLVQFEEIFVHRDTPLTANKLISLIGTQCPDDHQHRVMYNWFLEYVATGTLRRYV